MVKNEENKLYLYSLVKMNLNISFTKLLLNKNIEYSLFMLFWSLLNMFSLKYKLGVQYEAQDWVKNPTRLSYTAWILAFFLGIFAD